MDQWLILIGASGCQAGFCERAKICTIRVDIWMPCWVMIKYKTIQLSSGSGGLQAGLYFIDSVKFFSQTAARCRWTYSSAPVDVLFFSLSGITFWKTSLSYKSPPWIQLRLGWWDRLPKGFDCWLSHFQLICFCRWTLRIFKGNSESTLKIWFNTLWTDERWWVLAPYVDISNVFLYNELFLRYFSRLSQYVQAELTLPAGKAEVAGLMDLSAERHLCNSAWDW